MNYKTMLKGALALSLSLIVGTASAATTTQSDAAPAYAETFEAAAVDTPITNAQFRGTNPDTTIYGWLASEGDESKVIAGGPTGSTKALQLNTDAGVLTNLFSASVAGDLNDGITNAAGNATGAYFETEVKFVPSDTLDAGIAGGQDATKFAIYAYAKEDAPASTNLVVYHAYFDSEDPSLAENDYIGYTNETFNVPIDCDHYTKLRIEMKQVDVGDGYMMNAFSVAVNDGAPLTSDSAITGDCWFLTVEKYSVDVNKCVSSLNFKGTGEIDNIKAGVINETTEYAITWTAQNASVTNAAGTTLTAADTNFLAGATLTFTPDTDMVITNVLVDGAAVAFDPASYTYTVGSADATVAVYAGTQASSDEFEAGDNVDGTITADQAAWLNSYIGTYTYSQLAALTAWQDKYLLNVDPFNGAGTLTVTAITVGNDVQVTIALARTEDGTAISGNRAIKGVLKLSGTADLGTNFAVLSTATISDEDFSDGNTATATFSGGTAKFFKAVIEAPAAQ